MTGFVMSTWMRFMPSSTQKVEIKNEVEENLI
jgi:hypothetical protein